ncbi:MAG: response regulator transcription factor [Flavobacteriales bacterium]|jgi:DNA-binding response OmpR family regulator|nr:response regulator transcription factor [Flavobacteriales bacterium]
MSNPLKIILAEDEPALGQIIKESLETRNFEVTLCKNGDIAYQKYKEEKPQLLVLDIMMPVKDGLTLAQEIRKEDTEIPIIFLTSKSQVKDVVEGFEVGGNDYLKKPFSMEELIVRIHALLKRINVTSNELNIGKYLFNTTKQTLIIGDKTHTLTHRETKLLWHLYLQKNELLERSFILKKLWGKDDFFNARSMDVFISKLRKKLNEDQTIQIINIRGVGYKLVF